MNETTAHLDSERPANLQNRIGVWALAAANGISQLGNTVTYLAVPWFVLTTTGSASRTGVASAMFAVATIASGLTIGNLIDHIGFRRMSILADALSGVTVLAIPVLYLLDWLTFWQLLVLIFLGSYFDTPGNTARGALTPALANVSRMPLERANSAIRMAGVAGGIILGPLIFGVLSATIGTVNLLFVDAGTFAVSILVVALLVRAPLITQPEVEDESVKQGKLDVFLAGFRFLFRDSVMRTVLPTTALYGFILSAYFGVVLPVYVDDQFGEPAYLGTLIAALGGGSLVGILLYGAVGHRYGRYSTLLVISAVSAAAIWLFTVPAYLPTDLVAMFIFGFATGPFNPLMRTILQKRTPERLLGRVLNALFTLASITPPLGLLIAGIAIDTFGLQPVQYTAAILISLVPLWVALAPWPRRAAPAFEG